MHVCKCGNKAAIPAALCKRPEWLGSRDYSYLYHGQELAELRVENEERIHSLSIFLASYPGLTIVIPEGYTQILENAFFGIRGLERVVLPRSMESILSGAFKDRADLKAVEGLESTLVTEIPFSCFSGSGLPAIRLPEGILDLEKKAIPSLVHRFTVPVSLKYLDFNEFSHAEELWCTQEAVGIAIKGSHACCGGAVLHIRMKDGSVVTLPREPLTHGVSKDLVRFLQSRTNGRIEDIALQLVPGKGIERRVLLLQAVAESFLEGDRKETVLKAARRNAGAAAVRAYELGERKDARHPPDQKKAGFPAGHGQ